MKCVKDEEKKGFRPLTNRFELEKCRKLEEIKVFGDKIRIGWKEKREVSRCLSFKKTRLTLMYI